MKVQATSLLAWTLASSANAFVVPSTSFVRSTTSTLTLNAQNQNQNEFDFLLNEKGGSQDQVDVAPRGRRVMATGSQKKVQLASAVVADVEEDLEGYLAGEVDDDMEASTTETSTLAQEEGDAKLAQFQEEQGTNKFSSWLGQADFQEVAWTLVVPTLLAFAGLKFGFTKVNSNLSGKAEDGLESFANEMIYHDGNIDEMQLCKLDWDGKLAWLGPSKKKRMINAYLEDYAKRKPVSPQAISSISYVFTLFGLSEEQSADIMVAICKEGGAEKISSANKLLFFGTHIFESQEAKDKLQAIKDIIKSTYRTEAGADTIVDTSQYAMGESAYRNVVQKNGGSKKLPDGWQVLGLTQDAAKQVYAEEDEAGFKTAQEELYGELEQRYNKKGQRIDENGHVIDEKDKKQNELDAENETPSLTSGAYECGNCGYTLFVAAGREAKFFGTGFVCPECGAKKDEFKEVEDLDD